MERQIERKINEIISKLRVLNNYTDLKLHNLYYNNENNFKLSQEKFDILFYEFCNIEFDTFVEFLRDLNIDFWELKTIRNTSCFYCLDKNLYNIDNVFTMLLEGIGYECNDHEILYINYIDNEKYKYIFNHNHFYDNDYEYIYNNLLELEIQINNHMKLYDYIQEFKKNSIENFKKFLEISEII